MVSKAFFLILLLALVSEPGVAQQPAPGHVDPMPVLKAASKAMGADKLNCVTISGSGYAGKVGQNVTQDTDWPRGEPLANYTRTINYAARSSVEQFERRPGMKPPLMEIRHRLAGRDPAPAERAPNVRGQRRVRLAPGRQGERSGPGPRQRGTVAARHFGSIRRASSRRQCDRGANPTAIWRWEMAESGRDGATTGGIEKLTVVSAHAARQIPSQTPTVNSQNLIQRIQTWVPHPVLGDMNYEHEYTQWQEIDGVKFPGGWHHHDGWDDERQIPDHQRRAQRLWRHVRQDSAECVRSGDRSRVHPRSKRPAGPRGNGKTRRRRVAARRFRRTNSVAVEFDKFVAIVEAPLDEERSLAVIEAVVKLVPDKPIRFVVNTHAHYDHLGGLRTYLHVGATVITHQRNRVFYETETFELCPADARSRHGFRSIRQPKISEGYTMEDVDEKYVLSDGKRMMDIYYVQGLNSHVEGMLMAYLPQRENHH